MCHINPVSYSKYLPLCTDEKNKAGVVGSGFVVEYLTITGGAVRRVYR